jgi:hypothetical protein
VAGTIRGTRLRPFGSSNLQRWPARTLVAFATGSRQIHFKNRSKPDLDEIRERHPLNVSMKQLSVRFPGRLKSIWTP